MTVEQVFSFALGLLSVLISWPVFFLVAILIFRKQIAALIPDLSRRVRKAPGGWEFENEGRALKDAIDQGIRELGDKPKEFADYAKNQVEKLTQSIQDLPPTKRVSLLGCGILWVDDKPINNSYEIGFLRSLGASIDTVTSTREAVDAIADKSYDLIISDVRRYENGVANPEAGYQLLEWLISKQCHIPLIYYTATKRTLDKNRTKMAFAITGRSAELISAVLSVLTRRIDG